MWVSFPLHLSLHFLLPTTICDVTDHMVSLLRRQNLLSAYDLFGDKINLESPMSARYNPKNTNINLNYI